MHVDSTPQQSQYNICVCVCVSINECREMFYVHTHVHTHTIEYCPVFKKKGILLHATTWVDLKDIVLSKISPSQKDKYYMISLT